MRYVDMVTQGKKVYAAREYCQVVGCGNPTTERKQYCIDHIEQQPYIKHVLSKMAEDDAEEARTQGRRGWKAVDVHGTRATEIVDALGNLAVTYKRLALRVKMEPPVLDAYLKALQKAGLVKVLILGSRRGSTPRKVVAPVLTR